MLHLIDPICVLNYGHNWGAVERFADSFATTGEPVTSWICSKFNRSSERRNIRRALPHFYGLDGSPVPSDYQHQSDNIISEIFKTFSCQDRAFIIGADGITLQSLATLGLRKDLGFSFQHLMIRLIGTLEHNYPDYHRMGLSEGNLKTILDTWTSKGIKVSVYAETKTYASALEQVLGSNVGVMPYPMQDLSHLNVQLKGERIVAFVGAARADKGYFDILKIARSFSSIRKDNEIFLVQEMQSQGLAEIDIYNEELARCPGVRLIKPTLSDTEMEELMSRIELFALPYDQGIYKYRGSAMLFEAASRQRGVIAYEGLGFSRDIADFEIGLLSRANATDFSQKIRLALDRGDAFNCSSFIEFSQTALADAVNVL